MKSKSLFHERPLDRRSFLTRAFGVAGASAATWRLGGAEPRRESGEDYLKELEENERKIRSKDAKPMIGVGDKLKITKVETMFVKPRWLFLKIHTNAGITGLGEPIVEGRAKTVATAVEELMPYLIGKDPRPVAHHWQAMYRHAFSRRWSRISQCSSKSQSTVRKLMSWPRLRAARTCRLPPAN